MKNTLKVFGYILTVIWIVFMLYCFSFVTTEWTLLKLFGVFVVIVLPVLGGMLVIQ